MLWEKEVSGAKGTAGFYSIAPWNFAQGEVVDISGANAAASLIMGA
jgi:hypothetical protein